MILQSLGNTAIIHNLRGQFETSLKIYNEVINAAEDIYDLRAQAQTYGNYGIVYKNMKKYDDAIENFTLQLNFSKNMAISDLILMKYHL